MPLEEKKSKCDHGARDWTNTVTRQRNASRHQKLEKVRSL